MTTTDKLVSVPVRLDIDAHAPAFSKAMSHLDNVSIKELDRVDFDAGLRELVRLRASQLNGCAYCVDTHSKDAHAVGESAQRLNAIAIWHESPFFTARERAALAFTEAVTLLAQTHVPAQAYANVAEQFSPAEVAALLALIVTINAWNTLAVASRAWEPTLDETASSR
jgi:AhpD family alkylhydroperoxidase